MQFAEDDLSRLTREADVAARGEKIGSNTDDLRIVLVDPGDSLNEDRHRAPATTDMVGGGGLRGPLSKGHDVGIP